MIPVSPFLGSQCIMSQRQYSKWAKASRTFRASPNWISSQSSWGAYLARERRIWTRRRDSTSLPDGRKVRVMSSISTLTEYQDLVDRVITSLKKFEVYLRNLLLPPLQSRSWTLESVLCITLDGSAMCTFTFILHVFVSLCSLSRLF